MSDKASEAQETPPKAALIPKGELLNLLRRLGAALPLDDRRALAMSLIENDVAEITFRRDGTTWTIAPWDIMISHRLFVDGNFQGREIEAVLAWMRRNGRFAAPRDCIVDAGANIGTSTIPFAQATTCRVLAIEPMPEPFALLSRNVANNGLAARVTCIRSAVVAGLRDVVHMVLPAENGGGGEVVRADRELSFAGRARVRSEAQAPAAGLSAILAGQGVAPEHVAFVWSDTQGCEVDVIETGRALWSAGAPLFVEFDPGVYGLEGTTPLVAAALAHFAAFIPAEALIANPAVAARPIAALPAHCLAQSKSVSDCLLIP
jgi:FkbM family methyltransferase